MGNEVSGEDGDINSCGVTSIDLPSLAPVPGGLVASTGLCC